MILQRASVKVFIIQPRCGTTTKKSSSFFFFWVVSQVADVTFAERRRILKETEEKREWGWNFERSVTRKKMRKEGLGTVGLLQDVLSGRQERVRERDSSASS